MANFDSTLDFLAASGGLQVFVLMALWATIALAVAWFVARRLRHGSAATRYCVWQSALAGLLALPIFFVSMPGIPLGWDFSSGDSGSNMTRPAMGDAVEIEAANQAMPSPFTRPIPPQSKNEKQSEAAVSLDDSNYAPADSDTFVPFMATSWKWLLVVFWGLGAAIHFGFVMAGLVRTRRLWSNSEPLAPGLREPLLGEMARWSPGKNRVAVRMSREIQVPIALGVFRPSILLPTGCMEWPMSRIQMVLSHELAHIERRDIFWQLLARVTAAFYWPHPLVWLAVRRMKAEREQACDDHVLQSGVGQRDYAKGLFEVAAGLSGWMMPLSGGIRMVEPRQIEIRLRSILDDSRPRGPATQPMRYGLVLGTICLVMLLALVRPFSPLPQAIAEPIPQPQPSNAQQEPADRAIVKTANPAQEEEKESLDKDTNTLDKKNYTFAISVSGWALDLENQPVTGATIYLVSQRGDYKRLGKTTTDKQGRYAFHDVPLPIERADTNHDRDTGAFLVFGRAAGYGFAWRPLKWFYPQPNNDTFFPNKNDDLPRSFQVGEKIELDLIFSPPAALRGRIVDDLGKPIAKTRVMLWDCEPIRPDGYPTEKDFHTFWGSREFGILNASVPNAMKIRKTDADGRFEFAELPPDCRFRMDVQPPGFPGRMVWAATCKPDQKGISGYPMYVGQMDLTFTRPHEVSILVLYGDTGKPAPKVFVQASYEKEGDSCKTSNQKGLITLRLPPGKGKIYLLPAKGTPYLATNIPCEFPEKPAKEPIVVRMRPAGVAEIKVIDADTGKGIKNVDLWIEKSSPTPDGPPRQYRTEYYYRSWEVETHISHVEPGRTNADGYLWALFEPGTHRIGVGLRSLPEGYRVVEDNGVEIDAVVGKPTQVTFHVKKLP